MLNTSEMYLGCLQNHFLIIMLLDIPSLGLPSSFFHPITDKCAESSSVIETLLTLDFALAYFQLGAICIMHLVKQFNHPFNIFILCISCDHRSPWNYICIMHLVKQFVCLLYVSTFCIHVYQHTHNHND